MADAYEVPWRSHTFVAFDTETSGAFPIGSELCEIAAVKWKDGQIIDRFQSLVAVKKPMSDFIIGIHGITNEMVKNAPQLGDVVKQFREFVSGTIMVAHHAPFDMGFLAYEMERHEMKLLHHPVLCTSLLSIELFPEFENHKLQTLIQTFQLKQGQAHRALDDSEACMEVFLRCAEKVGPEATLSQIYQAQKVHLKWDRFSMKQLAKIELFQNIINAVQNDQELEIVYGAGSHPGQTRRVKPIGIVRSPDGDFLACPMEENGVMRNKRFYLKRISRATAILSEP
ncbi:MAG: exonuclease domain-containing protein [Bdellovibrionales bacterium]